MGKGDAKPVKVIFNDNTNLDDYLNQDIYLFGGNYESLVRTGHSQVLGIYTSSERKEFIYLKLKENPKRFNEVHAILQMYVTHGLLKPNTQRLIFPEIPVGKKIICANNSRDLNRKSVSNLTGVIRKPRDQYKYYLINFDTGLRTEVREDYLLTNSRKKKNYLEEKRLESTMRGVLEKTEEQDAYIFIINELILKKTTIKL